jgi:hypothetical protein
MKMERSKTISFVGSTINPNKAFFSFVSSFVDNKEGSSFEVNVF